MIDRSNRSEHAQWVARDLKRSLSDVEAALVDILCDAAGVGPWNLTPWTSLRQEGQSAVGRIPDDRMATFDFDALTRLVFAAHDRCARVSIEGSNFGRVRLVVYLRDGRDGRMHERHPTLEQAVAGWREHHSAVDAPKEGA